MSVSRAIAVVEDRRYLDHRGPTGHPERPERLTAVGEAIAARRDALQTLAPRCAEAEEIERIHSAEHLATVARACERAPLHLDPDTYVSQGSFETALLAAGASIDLARAVAAGRFQAGLAAVRPPGHHAERDRAMGFCLFNNVAVAARALQQQDGIGRVLILDWDVHHGNGTQHSFEDDPDVLYVSTHEYPQYPGTGAAGEVGVGRGDGATVNVPMPAGCGDAEYIGVFQRVLAPVARAFAPEMMLVSCGFDCHRDDPLAGMTVSAAGFAGMAAIVRALADELCGGRVAFVLEGGYALSGLREGSGAVLDALLPATAPDPPEAVPMAPGGLLARVVDPVRRCHGARVPGIGST